MKNLLVLIGVLLTFNALGQVPVPDQQIKEAVLALQEADRANAKIWGFNADGEMILLQNGNSGFVCLADDPNKKGFSVSCYQKDLEPFMARGRELQKDNKSFKEIFDIREAEAKKGKLKMPKKSIDTLRFEWRDFGKGKLPLCSIYSVGNGSIYGIAFERNRSWGTLDNGPWYA